MKTTNHIALLAFAALILAASATASPILDINIAEFMYEDNNWNGFCYNCAGLSGDTNAYSTNVYGSLNDANGTLTIKNTSGSTNLSDVVVYVGRVEETFGWGTAACTNASVINFWDSDSSDGNVIIHIRDLPSGTSIDCNYDINTTVASTPLVITEDYTFKTMVLTQINPITLKLINQDTARYPSINNVTITKTAVDTNSNGIRDFNFSNCNADGNGTVTNCDDATAAGGYQFTWSLGSYAINDTNGTTANPVILRYNAEENDYYDHNTTGFYTMGTIAASFDSQSAITDINVWRITAIAPASLQVYKRQDPDGNNGSSYDGYDWGFNLSFTNNTTDVNFNITKMSMWVTINTQSQDPKNFLAWHDFRNPNQEIDVNQTFDRNSSDVNTIYGWNSNFMVMPTAGANSTCTWAHDKNRLECTANPATYKLGPAQVWYATHGENIDSNGWWIDKNLAANPYQPDGNTPWVPVVWGDANFTISQDEWDFNLDLAQNSYTLTTKIYIIHDYIIEAKKTVTRVAEGDYNILVLVHNRGTKNTPQNVYVYDVIPSGFDRNANYPWAITRARGGTDLNAAVGDGNQPIYASANWDINGIAHWINVGPLDANNAGTTDQATVNYRVTGSGDYNAIDLFIVGVDPIQTDGPNVHGTPVARLAFLATQFTEEESTLAPVVGAVLVVGMLGGAVIAFRP